MPSLPAADVCHSSTQHLCVRVYLSVCECVCARLCLCCEQEMCYNELELAGLSYKNLSAHEVSQCHGKVGVLESANCYYEATSMSQFRLLFYFYIFLTLAKYW